MSRISTAGRSIRGAAHSNKCGEGVGASPRARKVRSRCRKQLLAFEKRACAGDAARFCGGNTLLIFAMENCLKRYLPRLSKACRSQLTPTDFRKYHRREAHPFDLFDW
jgi:hypothetical protein